MDSVQSVIEKIHHNTGLGVAYVCEGQMLAFAGSLQGEQTVLPLAVGELQLYGQGPSPEVKALAVSLMEFYLDSRNVTGMQSDIAKDLNMPLTGNKVVACLCNGDSMSIRENLTNLFTVEDSVRLFMVNPTEDILVVDLEKMEYTEFLEICSCLVEDAANELNVPFHIGVGGVFAALTHLNDSIEQARQALKSVMGSGLKFGLKEYKDCVLDSAANALHAESMAYIQCLDSIKGMDEFINPEFAKVFHIFISKNLNLSDTSREAYIHRNSLKYKFDKLYRISGLDLRNFNDAVVFKFLLSYYL